MTETLAKLADLFKSGRTDHVEVKTTIDVSSNGTTTVAPDSLAAVLRARFAELHGESGPTDERPVHIDIAVGHE